MTHHSFHPCSATLAWLFQSQKNGICLGLEAMQLLLEKLGHPEKKLRIVHIAGTNGKGSTAAFAESLLRAAGYSTGLYTSPHLVEINERIRLNGKNISKDCLEEGIKRLQRAIATWEKQPTFFELMTALALDVFARAGCEAVVLETGLGGRLDATNVTEKAACAITPISLDHTEWLGATLSSIAREKAGIMRPGIPAISAPQHEEARAALLAEAEKIHAPLTFITEPLEASYILGLNGSYQRWNAALALALIKQAGFSLPPEAEKIGFESVSWNGRFQKISLQHETGLTQTVVLDGAHNPAAVELLIKTWQEEFPYEKPLLIFGALADKDGKFMLQKLSTIAADVFLVPVISPRAALPSDFLTVFPAATVFSSLENCFKKLFFNKKDFSFLSNKCRNRPVLLTGSLFLVGEALALLQGEQYRASVQ